MNIKENIQVLKNAFEKGNLFPYYVLDIKTNKPSLIITFLSPVFFAHPKRSKACPLQALQSMRTAVDRHFIHGQSRMPYLL